VFSGTKCAHCVNTRVSVAHPFVEYHSHNYLCMIIMPVVVGPVHMAQHDREYVQ
jgi:hypothetical protein